MNWCSLLALFCIAGLIQGEEDCCIEQLECTCIKKNPECNKACDKGRDKDNTWCKWMPLTECSKEDMHQECPEKCRAELNDTSDVLSLNADANWCKWMPLTECSLEETQKECPEKCRDESVTLTHDRSSTPSHITNNEAPIPIEGFTYCDVDFNLYGTDWDSLSYQEWLSVFMKVSLLPDYCDEPIPPPFDNPSAEDIEFRLYDSITKNYSRLITADEASVDSSSFDSSLPMIVVVHGWIEDVDDVKWVHELKDQWLKEMPSNVILVQWKKLACNAFFPVAVNNAKFVGIELAALLNFLKNYTGLLPSNTHLIGFSLGAQAVGVAGHHLENLSRITGLDPAGPLFTGAPRTERLDESDAVFVDTIHTNRGGFGFTNPCGHVSFIMNGGNLQNGCSIFPGNFKLSRCSHILAHEYYIESLANSEPRYGYLCENEVKFQNGLCVKNANNTVGYGVTPNPAGIFYCNTQSPLVMPKGPQQLSREELEIQDVLSPTEGSARQSSDGTGNVIHINTVSPSSVQVHRPVENIVPIEQSVQPAKIGMQLSKLGLANLASLIRDALMSGKKESFSDMAGSHERKRPMTSNPNHLIEDGEYEELDDDMPVDGFDDVLGDTASRGKIFGVDVNEPKYKALFDEEDAPDQSYGPVKGDASKNPPQVTTQKPGEVIFSVTPPFSSTDEPNPDLPSIDSHLPTTWDPNTDAMNILNRMSDGEWIRDAHQKNIEKFYPKEEYNPYFLPVKMTSKLYKLLKSPAVKKKDIFFSKLKIKNQLFIANPDLCAALCD